MLKDIIVVAKRLDVDSEIVLSIKIKTTWNIITQESGRFNTFNTFTFNTEVNTFNDFFKTTLSKMPLIMPSNS